MSSFRKRNVQKPIPGTRTSPQTGQVITSSGNPSMDAILGGGLPIGSICLIEEDNYVTYSKVLAKYFLAEGIFSQQAVFLGSLDDDPKDMLRKIPKPLHPDEVRQELAAEKESADNEIESSKNGLRIAWRYNDLPIVNSEQPNTKIGHHFNLLDEIDILKVGYREITMWNDSPQHSATEDDEDTFNADEVVELIETAAEPTTLNSKDVEMNENDSNDGALETSTAMDIDANKIESRPHSALPPEKETRKIFHNGKFTRILREITGLLRGDKFNPSIAIGQYEKMLCRVCITSLASPLWYETHFPKDILKFLTVLRAVVRSSTAVCFITLPMHLVATCDASLVPKIRNLVDYAIELESFAGSDRETNPAFREYNGLFHLHKISAINTLSAFMPETSDLAFKLRRKKFVIEKLHLPPELQESGENQSDIAGSALNCSSNSKVASLDF